MKIKFRRVVGCSVLFLAFNTLATVHYVAFNSVNPTPPYTSWATASTDIQDAVDASANGDTVLVTNGVYASGGMPVAGGVTNRVALTNAITVQSVNGPFVTIIQGAGTNPGPTSVRCAWLTNNATLIGFTLMRGATSTSDGFGGGVWCASSNAVVNNCVIVSNTANQQGSGVFQGTYNNCLISSNNGFNGISIAVYGANLNSCTVVSNDYAGVAQDKVTNCIIYYNGNGTGNNYVATTFAGYCCTTPAPPGAGNFTNAPQLFADGAHLLSTSPCIGAGTNLVTGTDIFGNAWANPPSVGCAEYYPSPVVTQPNINLISNPEGFYFNAVASGSPVPTLTWLKDGVVLQNNGHFSGTQTPNLIVASALTTDAGNYQLVASNSFGVVTSAVATLVIHYVNSAGLNSVAPYLTLATAATNIQDAINAASSGDIVLVTNGLYKFGGLSMDGQSTNRVALNNAIRVQSINGPWVTTIQGGGATNGTAAVRCAWLTNNAVLVGFSLTGGATQTSGNMLTAETGGGVWCASSNSFVDNCVISSNTCANFGSGVYQGTLNNCLISSNAGNTAAYFVNLNSCTIIGNSVFNVRYGSMTNCIDYYSNLGPSENYVNLSVAGYCCTTPALTGTGNFTNAPQLQADGVHLTSGSPCIQTGTNLVIGTDIFGRAWANPPSIGCAEYNGFPTVSPPQILITGAPVGFHIGNAAYAGQPPLVLQWLENGVPLQNNGHFIGTQTSNLVAIGVSLADAGSYQLVVSNAYGAITSAAVQLVLHAVDAAGMAPEPPFLTWATAATNIQDAIESAAAGDIVLVTNGIYDAGGEAIGGLTNRVALDKALTVLSVNGWANTIIEGAGDPLSTTGPAMVRCAWLTNGAILSGFTLQDGATLNTGNNATLQCGGAVWCASSNALVSNCLLSNNFANYGGGGIAFGTLDNSLVINNLAAYGGGSYNATLNNCTVVYNATTGTSPNGGGTYNDDFFFGSIHNSIVLFNGLNYVFGGFANYPATTQVQYSYCCTESGFGLLPSGAGNIFTDPQFLDWYHISVSSPCRSAGSALYASGTDLDGEPWNNPPSIGCDEVVVSNRTGPLAVTMSYNFFPALTNVLVNHEAFFEGMITGLATSVSWSFGDGPVVTNTDNGLYHEWTNAGNYNVVFTAYNETYPAGVSTNLIVQVISPNPPQLQSPVLSSNGFQFEFTGQLSANYIVQYATNLTPPVTWATLQNLYYSTGVVYLVQDTAPTNAVRFYRVVAQ